MPAGDKGGAVGLKPIKTTAIQAWQQLFHSLIVTDPPLLRQAKRLSASTRRRRG